MFLMATAGVGAHVIINCLYGKQLQASMRCTADYGKFIHLGKLDMKDNSTIGMRMFLRNTSFCPVDVESITKLSKADKQELQRMIAEGMRDLVVKPLPRKVVEHGHMPTVLR